MADSVFLVIDAAANDDEIDYNDHDENSQT